MFTKSQKDLLKSVGRKPNHPDFGKPNPQLDEVILKLRRDNPKLFLWDSELADRVFYHQPSDVLTKHKGYIISLEESR
jgi:hypothetical protein